MVADREADIDTTGHDFQAMNDGFSKCSRGFPDTALPATFYDQRWVK